LDSEINDIAKREIIPKKVNKIFNPISSKMKVIPNHNPAFRIR
jgi:hypothetical protein